MILAGLFLHQVLQQACYDGPLGNNSISVQVFSKDCHISEQLYFTEHIQDLIQNDQKKHNYKDCLAELTNQHLLDNAAKRMVPKDQTRKLTHKPLKQNIPG
jgi:hypothetical protein